MLVVTSAMKHFLQESKEAKFQKTSKFLQGKRAIAPVVRWRQSMWCDCIVWVFRLDSTIHAYKAGSNLP